METAKPEKATLNRPTIQNLVQPVLAPHLGLAALQAQLASQVPLQGHLWIQACRRLQAHATDGAAAEGYTAQV